MKAYVITIEGNEVSENGAQTCIESSWQHQNEFSIEKFDKIETTNAKYLLLGDMLELGEFSKKLHSDIANNINKTQIFKVYVYGKDIIYTFNKLRTQKKGKIFKSNSEILRFINNEINNNDYLMVKGSNSTGLNEIIKKLN